MAIVDPVSDDRRIMLGVDTYKQARFSTAIAPEVAIKRDKSRTTRGTGRNTEPLADLETNLDDESYELLDDDEDNESDVLDDRPASRSNKANITATKQATGAEDAFQSYLRDIRGLGLLTH